MKHSLHVGHGFSRASLLSRRAFLRAVALTPFAVIPAASLAVGAPGQRAVFVSSYHEGYPPTDEIAAAIRERFASAGIPLDVRHLDAKRQPPERVTQLARETVDVIRHDPPSVLIAADDPAVELVVAPHFTSGALPVVFCGVNWSADQYGLPTPWVTGMLEVVPVLETLAIVRKVKGSGIRRLAVVSERTVSEEANRRALDPRYAQAEFAVEWHLVDTFDAWREAFARANREADVVYLPTNGAIKGWHDGEARLAVERALRVPVVTCDDFMMPWAVFGLTKVAAEQGEWAADTALRILAGASPREIPVAINQRSVAWMNPALARRIGFELPARFRGEARLVS
jgi:ABC-type uncharacterized transport system substrate-binding protein